MMWAGNTQLFGERRHSQRNLQGRKADLLYGFAEQNVGLGSLHLRKPGQGARNRQIWVEAGERL